MAKVKCSKAIWKEFTKKERVLWTKLYNAFNDQLNFAVGFDGTDKKSKKMQEVTAHNMACVAVWELSEK